MRTTQFAHQTLHPLLKNGITLIDATCGNGHDSAFLAQNMDADSHLICLDIQAPAIQNTQQRIEATTHSCTISLLQRSHTDIPACMRAANAQELHGILYNLGYLPGSDKTVQTQAHTTLASLSSALNVIPSGGFISLTLYPGHPAGKVESDAVENWVHEHAARFGEIQRYTPEAPKAPRFLILTLG